MSPSIHRQPQSLDWCPCGTARRGPEAEQAAINTRTRDVRRYDLPHCHAAATAAAAARPARAPLSPATSLATL